MRELATVVAVRLFPVKSAGGPPREELEIELDGVRHDRAFAVVADDGDAILIAGSVLTAGSLLTAEDLPVLRQVIADVDAAGRPTLVLPSGERVSGSSAAAALSRLLGRAVRVVPVERGRRLEAPVHLVSRQAVAAALRGEHDAADCACSLEQPRANLELDLADPVSGRPIDREGGQEDGGEGDREGGWESGWTGSTVHVGTAVLALHRRPGHCLGVYAQVQRPGRVRVGDAVLLADTPGAHGG